MSPLLFFLSISGLFCLLRAATLMLSRFYMRILHKEANTHRKVFQNQWSSSTPSEAIISIPLSLSPIVISILLLVLPPDPS